MVTPDVEVKAVKVKQGVRAPKDSFYLVNCVPAGIDASNPSWMQDAGESITAAGFVFFPGSFYDKGSVLVSETPIEI